MVKAPTSSCVLYPSGQVTPPSMENSMWERSALSTKVKVMEPLLLSQFGSKLVTVTSGASPEEMITVSVDSQSPSVTVTLYSPAQSPVTSAVVAPLLHNTVWLPVPPTTDTCAEPSQVPGQVSSDALTVRSNSDPCPIVTVWAPRHPLASVTSTS